MDRLVEIKLFRVRENETTERYYFGCFNEVDLNSLNFVFKDRVYNRLIPVDKAERILKCFENKYRDYESIETSLIKGKKAYMLSSFHYSKLIQSINTMIDDYSHI